MARSAFFTPTPSTEQNKSKNSRSTTFKNPIIRGVSRPCIGFPSRYSIVCRLIVSPSRFCSERRVNSEISTSCSYGVDGQRQFVLRQGDELAGNFGDQERVRSDSEGLAQTRDATRTNRRIAHRRVRSIFARRLCDRCVRSSLHGTVGASSQRRPVAIQIVVAQRNRQRVAHVGRFGQRRRVSVRTCTACCICAFEAWPLPVRIFFTCVAL